MQIALDEPLAKFRTRLSAQVGVDAKLQKIVFKGKLLKDDTDLTNIGIENVIEMFDLNI